MPTVYEFETFVRGAKPTPNIATVTISKRGSLSMNRRAFSVLGEPKAVVLRYDAKHKAVALRPVDENTPNAFNVRKQNDSENYSVAFRSFSNFYNIDTEQSRRYHADLVDGDLVIDTKRPAGIVMGGRTPRKSN